MNKLLIIGYMGFLLVLLFGIVTPLNVSAVVSCSGGNCWFTACSVNSDCGTNQFTGAPTCQGNTVYQNYITYTCNNPRTADSYCTTTITPRHQMSCSSNQTCKVGICFGEITGSGSQYNYSYNYPYSCTPYSYQKCVGNSVYWFDSCNNQQNLYQSCREGQTCSNGICVNNQLNYNSRSIKGCINNTVYWYDSLGNRQDVYQNCSLTGQTCQNGQCTGNQAYTQTVQTTYAKHYVTKCYNDKIYWYDSKGAVQDIYKDCSDDNQCTLDGCQDGQCKNELKCDGSTCAVNTPDYGNYCKELKTTAAVSENPSVMEFLKKWYVWIIIAAALVFLFIVIFRRLSSKV